MKSEGSWFRRVLSREPGTKIGGPLGHLEREAMQQADEEERQEFSRETRDQATFFIATFALLAKMAKADGVVGLGELTTIDRFVDDELECSPRLRRFAVRVFHQARDMDFSFEQFASQFRKVFGKKSHLRFDMLELLYRVAMADGVIDPEEQRLLEYAERKFGVSKDDAQFVRAEWRHPPECHYAALRLHVGATRAQVEEAYRRLCEEYDPDLAVEDGLPREFLELTRRKRLKIEEAYQKIIERLDA